MDEEQVYFDLEGLLQFFLPVAAMVVEWEAAEVAPELVAE